MQPELVSGYARPGATPTGYLKSQPCARFSVFWASLGDKQHGDWLRKRAVTGDLDMACNNIQQQVYTRVWLAAIRMVKTLDFTVDTHTDDSVEDGQGVSQEEEQESDHDVEVDTALNQGMVFQASGMTGREQPRSMRDVEIFLNLVDFIKLMLGKVEPKYFEDTCYVFCATMIKLSARNALFSGFFKLLTAAMKSARSGEQCMLCCSCIELFLCVAGIFGCVHNYLFGSSASILLVKYIREILHGPFAGFAAYEPQKLWGRW